MRQNSNPVLQFCLFRNMDIYFHKIVRQSFFFHKLHVKNMLLQKHLPCQEHTPCYPGAFQLSKHFCAVLTAVLWGGGPGRATALTQMRKLKLRDRAQMALQMLQRPLSFFSKKKNTYFTFWSDLYIFVDKTQELQMPHRSSAKQNFGRCCRGWETTLGTLAAWLLPKAGFGIYLKKKKTKKKKMMN